MLTSTSTQDLSRRAHFEASARLIGAQMRHHYDMANEAAAQGDIRKAEFHLGMSRQHAEPYGHAQENAMKTSPGIIRERISYAGWWNKNDRRVARTPLGRKQDPETGQVLN